MRFITTAIIFLFFSELCFAQNQYGQINEKFEGPGISKLIFTDSEETAKKLANDDLKNGEIYLILHNGEAPIVYKNDEKFEKRFSAQYYEFGCVGPEQIVAEAYDSIMFKYLDLQFGREWRKKIRKDVVGFKSWRKKNKE